MTITKPIQMSIYWSLTKVKAAIINILKITKDQTTMCNVKGVTSSDKPSYKPIYQMTHLTFTKVYSLFQLGCVTCTFIVWVHTW